MRVLLFLAALMVVTSANSADNVLLIQLQAGAGPARVHETGEGVTISLPEAKNDKVLLIDRDDCNHVRVWHSAGTTNLAEDQIADIFMSALPGGGKRLSVGQYHVKAFITRQGVTSTLWPVAARK